MYKRLLATASFLAFTMGAGFSVHAQGMDADTAGELGTTDYYDYGYYDEYDAGFNTTGYEDDWFYDYYEYDADYDYYDDAWYDWEEDSTF